MSDFKVKQMGAFQRKFAFMVIILNQLVNEITEEVKQLESLDRYGKLSPEGAKEWESEFVKSDFLERRRRKNLLQNSWFQPSNTKGAFSGTDASF